MMRPDYSYPFADGFSQIMDESKRFATQKEVHFEPEKRQSGNLSADYTELPVDATGESGTPWKNLR